jgi:hypothetical protein
MRVDTAFFVLLITGADLKIAYKQTSTSKLERSRSSGIDTLYASMSLATQTYE